MTHQTLNPIAKLNDRFRASTANGWICGLRPTAAKGAFVTTARVGALAPEKQLDLFLAVQNFSQFSEDNDPHGEHDFGAIEMHGMKWFWKIDYYADASCEWGSENPADDNRTYRVLTLMHASDY